MEPAETTTRPESAIARPGKRQRTQALLASTALSLANADGWANLSVEAVALESGLVAKTARNNFLTRDDLVAEAAISAVDKALVSKPLALSALEPHADARRAQQISENALARLALWIADVVGELSEPLGILSLFSSRQIDVEELQTARQDQLIAESLLRQGRAARCTIQVAQHAAEALQGTNLQDQLTPLRSKWAGAFGMCHALVAVAFDLNSSAISRENTLVALKELELKIPTELEQGLEKHLASVLPRESVAIGVLRTAYAISGNLKVPKDRALALSLLNVSNNDALTYGLERAIQMLKLDPSENIEEVLKASDQAGRTVATS